jgi:predicted aminopeptidase
MTHKGNKLDTWRCWFPLIVGFFLNSCSTVGFYSQALVGQTEILRRAQPNIKVISAPKTKPLLASKLRTVKDLRDFAKNELHLPSEGQYDHYADLGRRYAVWVIYAAPEFSLEAKRWWYPLVGNLKYRGFFKESVAEREATKLRDMGMDVYVGGVAAYSTLGYLKDPLLNTFIGRDDAGLAELIFHELTHQRVYLSGDTDFNEALATVVGREGARRWLKARGRSSDLAQYEKEILIEEEFIREALQTRAELKVLYDRQDMDQVALRQAKEASIAQLKVRLIAMNRRYGGSLKLGRWFEKPVNNARLNTLATYHDLVPGFEVELQAYGGDLEEFLKRMEAMKKLKPSERRVQLKLKSPTP